MTSIIGKNSFVGNYFIKKYHTDKINEIDLLDKKLNEIKFIEGDSIIHLAALVHQMAGAPEKNISK